MLVEVLVPPDELIIAQLWVMGSTGIEERDDRLIVGFDDGTDLSSLTWPWREIEPYDWIDGQRDAIETTRIGGFVVHPPWLTPVIDADEIEIVIDPGPAFGHGGHVTTRLVLELFARCEVEGHPVLDLGCGTGVLAIAAAKLGASRVSAVDHDPEARATAAANAAINDVMIEVASRPEGAYDIALVNVTIDVHEALAGTFTADTIIASGVFDEQWDRLLTVYGSAGTRISQDGWSAALFSRKTSHMIPS